MTDENIITGDGILDPASVVSTLDVKEGMSVADFGCGAGHFTILFAQKVGEQGKVYAFDVQEGPLEAVHDKAKAAGLRNVEVVRANLEMPGSTQLLDNSQDVVLMANILFQSTKKADIIREAARVLKPGGMIVAVEWVKGKKGFGPPDGLRSDQAQLTELLEKSNFTVARTHDAGQFHYVIVGHKQ